MGRTVKLASATYARLSRYRDKLHEMYVAGLIDLPENQVDNVSLDYAVNVLLDGKESHRKRARRQQKRRRQGSTLGAV